MTENISLKRNIIWAACVFSLFISLVFSGLNFLVVYAVEDTFFEQLLAEEVKSIQETWQKTGTIPKQIATPRKSFIQVFDDVSEFPDDLLSAYKKAPNDDEYRGKNGNHYHLYYLAHPNKILVAEVSDYLIVRPLKANILTVLFVLSALMFLLASILGYFMAKRAIAPVTKLADLLTTTSPEDLPTNFSDNYPKNEIGLLANKLEQAMARIKAFILREQHFTRDTSHELRTPITIIKNALELLAQKKLNSEEKVLIERISLANQQMEQTITTLLSLAREHNDNSHTVADEIFILPSIEKAVIEQSPLLDDKEVELDIDVSSTTKVLCSPTVLQILLTNLISNAFHYTEQGHIFIHFEHNTLCIGDTSGGIDEDIQSNVTSTLVKGKKSQGFGIGLSLVKRLCEKYQLTFNIESSSTGVTATIAFPRKE